MVKALDKAIKICDEETVWEVQTDKNHWLYGTDKELEKNFKDPKFVAEHGHIKNKTKASKKILRMLGRLGNSKE